MIATFMEPSLRYDPVGQQTLPYRRRMCKGRTDPARGERSVSTTKALPVRDPAPDPLIGARLRLLRQARHLTVGELSEATGLSKAFISRVERDLKLPSLPALLALCRALRVEVGDVFRSGGVDRVALGDAPEVDLGGTGIVERLVTPVHERGLQILHSVVEPGGHSEADAYTVECRLEAVHLVSGEFVLVVDGTDHVLATGDTLTFPGDAPHTWHNPGTAPATVLWVLAG